MCDKCVDMVADILALETKPNQLIFEDYSQACPIIKTGQLTTKPFQKATENCVNRYYWTELIKNSQMAQDCMSIAISVTSQNCP